MFESEVAEGKPLPNKEVAYILDLLGDLIIIAEDDTFRGNYYKKTARNVELLGEPIYNLTTNKLQELLNIKESLAQKIIEISRNGKSDLLDEMLSKVPATIVELLQIRGLGPKRIRMLWKNYNITSCEDLLNFSFENLKGIKGIGEKSAKVIWDGLLQYINNKNKMLLPEAQELFLKIKYQLEKEGNFEIIEPAGEFKRRCETIGTLTIVALGDKSSHKEILGNNKKISIYLCSSRDSFIRTLFEQTSTKEHINLLNIQIPSGELASEEDIYKANNLPYIIPELREGLFEKEWLKNQNKIIEEKDIKGIIHIHTNYSDGLFSLQKMVNEVRNLDYLYCGIADHSQYAKYANGLTPERLLQQIHEIDELQNSLVNFVIFKGLELDILKNGELDDMGEVIKMLDFTVSSIHAGLEMDEDEATTRLIKAIEHPHTIILGHPTGRLLLQRSGYSPNIEKILDAAAKNNVIIEINAHPRRLDLSWHWMRKAADKGILLSINPDAHDLNGIKDVKWGVWVARKSGLPPYCFLNTLPPQKVYEIFNSIKKSKGMI